MPSQITPRQFVLALVVAAAGFFLGSTESLRTMTAIGAFGVLAAIAVVLAGGGGRGLPTGFGDAARSASGGERPAPPAAAPPEIVEIVLRRA